MDIVDLQVAGLQESRHLQRKTALVQDAKSPVQAHQAVGS